MSLRKGIKILMFIISMKVFCVKMVLPCTQNFYQAFHFHSPNFCISTNCSSTFVATETLMLETFKKMNVCFSRASLFLSHLLVKFEC